MNDAVLRYVPLVRFLKDALGEAYRVTLVDARDTTRALTTTQRGVSEDALEDESLGALLRDVLASEQLKRRDHLSGVGGAAHGAPAQRTSVYFIRDEAGEVVGFLCIEQTGQGLYMVSEVFDQLLNPVATDASDDGDAPVAAGEAADAAGGTAGRIEEEMNALLRERITSAWDKCLAQTPKPRKAEKMAFMSELFEMGIFRMRGAAAQVSEVTGISQASIYRYLGEILED